VSPRQWEPPETMRQAKRWETVKNRYLAAGLCIKCASQAAYGHQLAFSRIHPPCDDCAAVVAGFPIHATTVWRRLADPSESTPRPFGLDSASAAPQRGFEVRSQGRRELGDQTAAPSSSHPAARPSEATS
jgi:hypothetical protein